MRAKCCLLQQLVEVELPNLICVVVVVSLSLMAPQAVLAQEGESTANTASSIQDIDLASWNKAENEGQRLLVLIHEPGPCEKCALALDGLSKIVGQPEIPSGLEIVKSSSSDLIAQLGVKHVPALVYLKEHSYITYDGNFDVEDMLVWVQLARNAIVHKLNDDSFEHLTQAATGATTGDWLVAFYAETCTEVLSQLDILSVRIYGKINVAKVSIPDSPALVKRFKITDCPAIILFKQSKMYRFTLPALDAASLRSFVDAFYKNVQAQPVPVPQTNFDVITETIADYLKDQLAGENKNIVLISLCAAAASLMFIIFCCCRSTFGKQRKKWD